MFQEINEDSIYSLMNIFYNKVRADKNGLGDIFNNAIGTDEDSWEKHKAKIANFWKGMLLGTGDYSGQPLKTHLELPSFPQELFNVWLTLFEESLRTVYEKEEHISFVMQRAQMIAQRFQYMLYEAKHAH